LPPGPPEPPLPEALDPPFPLGPLPLPEPPGSPPADPLLPLDPLPPETPPGPPYRARSMTAPTLGFAGAMTMLGSSMDSPASTMALPEMTRPSLSFSPTVQPARLLRRPD
jgi:hypothetical protein